MEASAHRHILSRINASQSPNAMSHLTCPIEGPPRGSLSQALHQSRSNQNSPIIGTGPSTRSNGESPRSLHNMSSMSAAGGAGSKDSPSTTPRSQYPGGPVRNNSTPQVPTSKDSSPNSAAALAMEKRRNAASKADEAHILRTSSMDSTHSSMSSATSFSQNSSTADGGPSPGEIAMMIQSAGSAENLIRQLLREKRSAAAQNNQLFKLLNKQKSMMQGMHVDLEKAMVDREKYKRIAEQVTTLPETPDAPWQLPNRKASPAISTSSGPSTGSGEPLPIQRFPDLDPSITGTGAIMATEPAVAAQMQSATMPRTMSDVTVRPEEKDSKRNTAIKDGPAALQMNKTRQTTDSSAPSPQSPKTPNSLDATDSARASFTARRSMTQRKDGGQQSAPDSPTEAVATSPSTRKAPPAPLNLGKAPSAPQSVQSQPTQSTPTEDFGPAKHTDSDYTESEDDLPVFERGRKSTRELDDQEREVMMIRAHRASQSAAKDKSRSKSSKKSSAKGLKTPQLEELPKSPSFKAFSPPESPGTCGKNQPASIAGLLDVRSVSSLQESIVSPPLKSPGLPLSPRPSDRPIHAANPRVLGEGSTVAVASPYATAAHSSALAPVAALSPRPPRHPIPMPTSAPTIPLPQPPMSAPLHPRNPPAHNLPIPQSAAIQAPRRPAPNGPDSSHQGRPDATGPRPGTVYRGFASESYPDLLLPPNALPSISIQVTSSRLRPSRQSTLGVRNSNDEAVFTLGVFARSHNKQLWRVEKAAVSLGQLENQLKQTQPFNVKVPDRSFFTGHAPARIDARRQALEAFFESILNTPMNEKAGLILCKYFSTQVIPIEESTHERGQASVGSIKNRSTPDKVVKEGFLTKKGKNFGGWKARFFVLNEPVLRYYEAPGGQLLGAIKLTHAQIGRQSGHKRSPSRGQGDEDKDGQYRHAFLIMEPKRNNPSAQNQHVLCAESDVERDEWVEALMFYLGKESEPADSKEKSKAPTREGSARDKASLLQSMMKDKEKRDRASDASEHPPEDTLRGFSYSDSTPGQAPLMQGPGARNMATPPPVGTPVSQNSPNQRNISGPKAGAPIEDASTWGNKDPMSTSKEMISGPKNGAPISDASAWGNKDAISGPRNAQPITDASQWGNKAADSLKSEDNAPPLSPRLHAERADKEVRKRSFWGFRGHSTSDSGPGLSSSVESDSTMNKRATARPVFGIPLAEAIQYCMSPGSTLILPSVVYRCLQYLDSVGADMEEGIFRISGSTITINRLKERFNTEGDIDLVAESTNGGNGRGGFDVHAIASLLKLYLRELPERILTNGLYPAFLKAQVLDTEAGRIGALRMLVHKLPLHNWTLLLHLVKFLVHVDASSEMSKMTVRNIGIVFAPTLNLSNPIIAHFIKDFHAIFEVSPEGEDEDKLPIEITAPSPGIASGSADGANGTTSNGTTYGGSGQSQDPLGLQYDDMMAAMAGQMQLDDSSSIASDSTRTSSSMKNSGCRPPVSAVGGTARPAHQYSSLGALGVPAGDSRENNGQDSKAKRRESSMQMLMGGFPGPGTASHGPGQPPAGAQRKTSLPFMREE